MSARPGPVPPLRLRPLGRGLSQHVFLRAEQPDDGWVYKTPAVLPQLFLHPVTWRNLRPVLGWKQRLFDLATAPPLRSVLRRLPLVVAAANGVAVRRARRHRRRQFATMCEILSRLAREGLADVFLPFEFVVADCTILLDGAPPIRYRGPLLKQRRADRFFEYFSDFEHFDWKAVVVAQHRLWEAGVGFADPDEVFGPRNWALLDGRLYLADTGSLTENLGTIRRLLSDAVLDAREREIWAWWPEQTGRHFTEYAAFVRRSINRDELERRFRERPR